MIEFFVFLGIVRVILCARGTGPRATIKKLHVTVGRGPSDAIRASERVSLAIVRTTEKTFLVLFRT